ncbi:MAG TPA: DUF1080 domain-containing protein [Pirellulales bacterium]|jgi:hypothetical protein|nr:DUF1080 domain-containing protein [Pirellulales bacterium]
MSIKRLAAFVVLTACAVPASAAEQNTLTEKELDHGWVLLFDGETTFGWQATSDADWKVVDGTLVATSGKPGFLNTTTEFGDFLLKVDFRATPETNSGVFLRNPDQPKSAATDCYELNIADESISPFPTGSFVERQKANSYAANEGWQTFEVDAQGGTFVVRLDGRPVLEYTDPRPLGRGRIGLQFRTGKIEFRNIKLKPLGLESIFNGRDLAGWKTYPEMKSVFSVTSAGELNVKDGRGQLESEKEYGDFVLQLEVFSNGMHLNSGIFFRCIPGETMNGYECQIQNGYKDGDRSQPIDAGTGAIYRRQSARKVMADDFKWFPMTLVVSGAHMACWVNGIQVTDWTDTRPPDPNPRKGLRTAPGTLMIQGHDPTTDLSFRHLQAGELPPR